MDVDCTLQLIFFFTKGIRYFPPNAYSLINEMLSALISILHDFIQLVMIAFMLCGILNSM